MSDLGSLITPHGRDKRIYFLADNRAISLGTMWDAGDHISSWIRSRETRPFAAILTNSVAAASTVVGSIAAGAALTSIPLPARGVDVGSYVQFVKTACFQVGATKLLVDDEIIPLLPSLSGIDFAPFSSALEWPASVTGDPATFGLTQFTSGSTAAPKGVVLTQERIADNIESIIRWLRPRPGDTACSWLPLSHDMGLIGMFLAAMAAGLPEWGNGPDLVLMTPEMFLKRPQAWLSACSEFEATITAAPNFALEMAAARGGGGVGDLSSVRACITGAEPIRESTLMGFAAEFGEQGFRMEALKPAYGLAECALAVTGTPMGEVWRVAASPREEGNKTSGYPVVSCGPPLSGYEVRSRGGDNAGELLVRGPSVAEHYSDGSPVRRADGWCATGDIGFVDDGYVYVQGRSDDVFKVAGRKIHALASIHRLTR